LGYAKSSWELTRKEHRWHFSALHASEKQLEDFWIEDLAERMERLAPELWDMLGVVLSANRRQTRTKEVSVFDEQDPDGDQVMRETDNTNLGDEGLKESVGVDDVNIANTSNPNFKRKTRTATKQHEALGIIVCHASLHV
jgi:hypothetical protein